MSKTIQVSVTAEDIAAARKSIDFRCVSCPIAQALRRTFPDALVLGDRVRVDFHDYAFLPLTARTFIARFDAGRAVEPIIFELEVSE